MSWIPSWYNWNIVESSDKYHNPTIVLNIHQSSIYISSGQFYLWRNRWIPPTVGRYFSLINFCLSSVTNMLLSPLTRPWTILFFCVKIILPSLLHMRSWHRLTTTLFSNFLFTNLFSIKYLYFFILFHLFLLILTCSCQYSYNLMLTSNCMCRPYIVDY